jgi:hypothetical protein
MLEQEYARTALEFEGRTSGREHPSRPAPATTSTRIARAGGTTSPLASRSSRATPFMTSRCHGRLQIQAVEPRLGTHPVNLCAGQRAPDRLDGKARSASGSPKVVAPRGLPHGQHEEPRPGRSEGWLRKMALPRPRQEDRAAVSGWRRQFRRRRHPPASKRPLGHLRIQDASLAFPCCLICSPRRQNALVKSDLESGPEGYDHSRACALC